VIGISHPNGTASAADRQLNRATPRRGEDNPEYMEGKIAKCGCG